MKSRSKTLAGHKTPSVEKQHPAVLESVGSSKRACSEKTINQILDLARHEGATAQELYSRNEINGYAKFGKVQDRIRLSHLIRALRKVKGFTQEEMAESMSCSRKTYREKELGKQGFDALVDIAVHLGCNRDHTLNIDWQLSQKIQMATRSRYNKTAISGTPDSVVLSTEKNGFEKMLQKLFGINDPEAYLIEIGRSSECGFYKKGDFAVCSPVDRFEKNTIRLCNIRFVAKDKDENEISFAWVSSESPDIIFTATSSDMRNHPGLGTFDRNEFKKNGVRLEIHPVVFLFSDLRSSRGKPGRGEMDYLRLPDDVGKSEAILGRPLATDPKREKKAV